MFFLRDMRSLIKKISDKWKDTGAKYVLKTLETKCSVLNKKEGKNIKLPDDFNIFGTSICGDDTALLIEDGTIGLDAGPSARNIPLPDHLFISHHHPDHFTGLPAVGCKSAESGKKVHVYMGNNFPEFAYDFVKKVQQTNPDNNLEFHYVDKNSIVDIDKNTSLKFFNTNHSEGSLGMSVFKKQNGIFSNHTTFTSDVILGDPEMRKEPYLHSAKNLIVETSYFGNGASDIIYRAFGHSSLRDVNTLLQERKDYPDSITLIHIPYGKDIPIRCDEFEENIKEAGLDDNVGYIPSCRNGITHPLTPKSRKRV